MYLKNSLTVFLFFVISCQPIEILKPVVVDISNFEKISINQLEIVLAITISALAAFGALSLMMRLLTTVNFTPYVLYRILLGSLLIIWAIM